VTSRSLGAYINGALISDIWADLADLPSAAEPLPLKQQDTGLSNTCAERRKAATNALMALGVPAAAGFGIYYIWHLWHMIR